MQKRASNQLKSFHTHSSYYQHRSDLLDKLKRRNAKWKVNAKGRRVMIRKVNVKLVPRPFGLIDGPDFFGFVLIDLVDPSVRLITHCSGSLVDSLWYDAMSRRRIYHHLIIFIFICGDRHWSPCDIVVHVIRRRTLQRLQSSYNIKLCSTTMRASIWRQRGTAQYSICRYIHILLMQLSRPKLKVIIVR